CGRRHPALRPSSSLSGLTCWILPRLALPGEGGRSEGWTEPCLNNNGSPLSRASRRTRASP
ncbi:unnamed protein product, partial [Ectocarpus fasciculatus]